MTKTKTRELDLEALDPVTGQESAATASYAASYAATTVWQSALTLLDRMIECQ